MGIVRPCAATIGITTIVIRLPGMPPIGMFVDDEIGTPFDRSREIGACACKVDGLVAIQRFRDRHQKIRNLLVFETSRDDITNDRSVCAFVEGSTVDLAG